jgi:hypothetical protein
MPHVQLDRMPSNSSTHAALLEWRPDIDRFEREVERAELTRRRDELALAELECSLDLVDAELLALRASPDFDRQLSRQIDEWVRIRGRLLRLIRRMRLLAPD